MSKIVITGGNKGIGKATAMQLAKQGHSVVVVVRNTIKAEVVDEIKAETKNSNIYYVIGDLSSVKGCYATVEKIKTEHPDINVLINNAGVWMTEKQLTKDGFEMSFMINYLAPFILSTQLKEVLLDNAPARIVNINAGLYVKGVFDINSTPFGKDFHKIKTYANSKLCNTMFTLECAKQLENTGLSINAVHPGVIKTDLGAAKGLLGLFIKAVKQLWKSPEYGAEAPVWLATDSSLNGVNGKYFNEKVIIAFAENALDEKTRQLLWNKTLDWIKA